MTESGVTIESWAIQNTTNINTENWFSYSWVKQDYLDFGTVIVLLIVLAVFFYAIMLKFKNF